MKQSNQLKKNSHSVSTLEHVQLTIWVLHKIKLIFFIFKLGPGQLALFNLMKAYSLLDREVGYCQGLSFIAGILLMHVSQPIWIYHSYHAVFRTSTKLKYLVYFR